jgi:hypothetical protein
MLPRRRHPRSAKRPEESDLRLFSGARCFSATPRRKQANPSRLQRYDEELIERLRDIVSNELINSRITRIRARVTGSLSRLPGRKNDPQTRSNAAFPGRSP